MKTLADLSAYIAWLTWAVGGIAVVSIAALLADLWILHMLRRKHTEKTETEIIMDTVDGLRAQVDAHSQHTAGEHSALFKQLHKISGRLQFLVAKDVADELGALRAKKLDDEEQEKLP